MSEQKGEVEQLWYTWSDVGLNTIRAGFRVRAASAGLQELRTPKMQHLDRYQRYFLPQEVDSTVPPEITPVCLALINTGEYGRILVHKAYTGRDGIGRYGAFFIHLLTNLPNGFSARDAISLWQSSFWKTSDDSLVDHYETHLDLVSLAPEQLAIMQKRVDYKSQNREMIETYLPSVIQAYLTKKPIYKDGQQIPCPLYIIAPDNDVAHLITGLTQCLPVNLLKNLTFSTYEHNIFEAPTEIVGTCWLSEPIAKDNPVLEHIFPAWYANELLVLNCYTGIRSSLEDNPLLEYKPVVKDFANRATAYFLYGGDKFKLFLERAERFTEIDGFLDHFQKSFKKPSKQGIYLIIRPKTPANWLDTAEFLPDLEYQLSIIQLATYEPGWWWQESDKQNSSKTAIINLRNRSANRPEVMQALAKLARNAANEAIAMASEKKPALRKGDPVEVEAFKNVTDLIYCALLPEADPQFWTWLLQTMLGIKDIALILNQDWNIYALFASTGCKLFPFPEKSYTLLAPLLAISWESFGAFLTLRLPLPWTEIATRTLVSANAPTLHTQTAAFLAESYSRPIEDFFLALSTHADYWETLFGLFGKLTKAAYPGKMSLLFTLLNSELGMEAEFAEPLIRIAHLNADEPVQFLISFGPRYLPLYNKMSVVILDKLSKLIGENSAEKMHVLFSWLDTPTINTWLSGGSSGEKNLATIVKKVNLNGYEARDFLREYGQVYIQRYPLSSDLLEMFEKYVSVEKNRQSLLSILDIWLPFSLDQQTLERLLRAAKLTNREQMDFLKRYGVFYLKHFPASPILLEYTWTFYDYLWRFDIYRFQRERSPKEPSYQEQLLYILSHIPHPLEEGEWVVWHTIAVFVRDPSLLQTQTQTQDIVRSADRLLRTYVQQNQLDSCTKLLQLLAHGCIQNHGTLADIVNAFSGIFTPTDLVLLLYEIADCAGERIRMQPQEKALFVPCIASAYKFKNRFVEKDEQKQFFQLFLNILIPSNITEKTLKWVEKAMKKRYPDISGRWQKQITHPRYPLPPAATPSLTERFLLRWEGIKAMTQFRLALRSKNMERLARVSVHYMTTLNGNIPDIWQARIDTVIEKLNREEDLLWQQSPVLAPYLTVAANRGNRIGQQLSAVPPRRSAGNTSKAPPQDIAQAPSPAERPRVPQRPLITFDDRQKKAAFKKVQKALRSENIGKIVWAATDYMDVLELYCQQIPPAWWRMLDAAFSFFNACEDAETDTPDQEKEQAIITASENIRVLIEANELAPVLTEQERQRVSIASHRVAQINIQRMKDADRKWIRDTLAITNMSGMEPTLRVRPPKNSVEGMHEPGRIRRIFGIFAKLLPGQRSDW